MLHIGRYSGIMWQNWFKVFWMHKYRSYLVQMKASKRLRSDQPRNEKSHKRALRKITLNNAPQVGCSFIA